MPTPKHRAIEAGFDGKFPQTKHSKPMDSVDWVTTEPADFSPRSAKVDLGGDHGNYSRGEGRGPRRRRSWNGVPKAHIIEVRRAL